jgi:parallel beta-helix repeat protein
LTGSVFNDRNQDGFMDPGEAGILNQAVLLRRVDGTIYKETTTNIAGDFSFIEIFPFRHWLVMEVDFARYKATGATFVVDDGGPLAPGEINVPQIQPGGDPFRTELGPVITEGILSYATTTSEAYFGKANYIGAENGGISGIIHYATTRAENDPAYAGAEPWEPGIPRVQVNLYMDADYDGIIDDLNNSGFPTVADVDNYPFDNFPGPEDEDHDQSGTFDPGDAVSITWSDSWDDNLPTGCVIPAPQIVHGQVIPSCAETWQTFNQIRPAVWDGGYAFDSYYPGGIFTGSTETSPIPMGVYIVEAATPPFFEDVKEEDKNVDFGEEYYPHVLSLPPPCVGELHTVPDELTFFPGVDAPYAGDPRPLCDKKQLTLSPGQNAAADFFMFTPVPKAARVKGLITDDINLATDPDSVNFGEKFGTAWVPVAFRDFNGNELVRTYADEWGGYEALIPSTFTNNRPSPSGMSPNMLQVCINDFGPIPDPANPGVMIEDPYADTRWSTICYNFDFLPGKITTLDTPLIQNAAFPTASATLDCNYPDGSPQIYRVDGPGGGPWADGVGTQITIQSVGTMQVPNPDYNPQDPGSEPRLINRDYSFGATPGRVTLSNIDLQVDNWTASSITATITPNLPGRQFHGQLLVHRGDNGLSSTLGVTMTVGEGPVVHVPAGSSIQSAIDSAVSGSILLIEPGTYKESIILYKKLRLQGYGAFSTTIVSSISFPKEANEWQARFQALIDSGDVDVIGGQLPRFGIEGNMIPPVLTVATSDGEFGQADNARIDGLTISRSYNTAILVNAYAYNLEISNNRIRQNQGGFAGGIRIGSPSLINDAGDGFLSNFNHNIRIHNNHIAENAGISGSGGISIFNGSDGYRINDNRICGNYTMLYGGGIAHFGLSDEGVIQANEIIFNESTDEGAGVIIAGELPIGGSGLSPGSGSVILNANLIQGNLAWDDGGGIRTLMTNGQDVSNNPDEQGLWYLIRIYNNIIVNNSSSDSGGGISMDDSARITISQNTIAHNDSTSSGIDAFGNCNPAIPPDQFCPGSVTADSVPKVAGISSNAHSSALRGAFGAGLEQTYSNPGLFNNIIWQNRTFWWDSTYYGGQGGLRPDVGIGEPATYWDLAVEGTLTPERLNPRYSILTDTANYHQTNQSLDPQFVFSYFNIYEAIASVEWGYVHPTFTPISPIGDYHLTLGSPAIDAGLEPLSNDPLGHKDFDWEVRPLNLYDMGADEFYPTAAPVALPHDVDADDEDYGFPEIETEETSLGCGGR